MIFVVKYNVLVGVKGYSSFTFRGDTFRTIPIAGIFGRLVKRIIL